MHDLPAQIDLEEAISGANSGPFDYSQLNRYDEALARSDAQLIRSHSADIARKGVDIGRALIRQKSKLHHGLFTAWIAAECNISYGVATRLMRLAQAVEQNIICDEVLNGLGCKALDMVISDSTSQEVRDEVEARVLAGEAMTADDVRRLREAGATVERLRASAQEATERAEKAERKLKARDAKPKPQTIDHEPAKQAKQAKPAEPDPDPPDPPAGPPAVPREVEEDDAIDMFAEAVLQLSALRFRPEAFVAAQREKLREAQVKAGVFRMQRTLDAIGRAFEERGDGGST